MGKYVRLDWALKHQSIAATEHLPNFPSRSTRSNEAYDQKLCFWLNAQGRTNTVDLIEYKLLQQTFRISQHPQVEISQLGTQEHFCSLNVNWWTNILHSIDPALITATEHRHRCFQLDINQSCNKRRTHYSSLLANLWTNTLDLLERQITFDVSPCEDGWKDEKEQNLNLRPPMAISGDLDWYHHH